MDSLRNDTPLGSKIDDRSGDNEVTKNVFQNNNSLNNSRQKDESTEDISSVKRGQAESGYYTTSSYAVDVHRSSTHWWKTNVSVESSMNNKMFKINNLCFNIPHSVDEFPSKHSFALKRPWEDNEELPSADPNTPFKKFRTEMNGGEDSSLSWTQRINAHVDNSIFQFPQPSTRFEMNWDDAISFNPKITSTPAFKQPQTDSNLYSNNNDSSLSSPPTIPTTKNTFGTEIVSILEDWYARHVDDPYIFGDDLTNLTNQCQLEEKQVRKWLANKRSRFKNTLKYNGKRHPLCRNNQH
ncbi:hypothetical protein HELRODRAFT_162815 [Helobdella robusta]|uniref:Homeobox domain-containing protein n=1 Tax=Helobdella robusta TaxID=6412 RepID=T1ET75_HELRO|nr:hypothetical protein HELRODRAFT_162815 [Helobdella robusta]ESN99296.1 hypothetical protein HELRODRAFT_162815 [Helobdella robusta]